MDEKTLTGIRLRMLREERGLTNDELCADIYRLYGVKINRGSYSRWERGLHEPMLQFVRIFAQYYGESMDFICGLSNQRKYISRADKNFGTWGA